VMDADQDPVQQLRKALKKVIDANPSLSDAAERCTDSDISRYIRARKGDVDDALAQLEATLRWRTENNIDRLFDTPDTSGVDGRGEYHFQTLGPHLYFGQDKTGRPIYWERTGLVSVSKMLEQFTSEEILGRHIRHMELTTKGRMGDNVTQQIIVMDMKGLSLKPDSKSLRIFKDTIDIDQLYYPERLGILFIVNAPWLFKPLWAMIRPWLDPITVKKFQILSAGANLGQTLIQYIDADQIPEEYGGTAKVKVPYGDEDYLAEFSDDSFLNSNK